MARLARIALHPIKALNAVTKDSVRISEIGGLVGDREFAIVDADGEYVNGKRTPAVHRLQADFDDDLSGVRLATANRDQVVQFDLEEDQPAMEAWLSDFFGYDVSLERGEGGSLTDSSVLGDTQYVGPTLISQATLDEVASWFEEINAAEMERRLRPNLVIDGVEAFWEDQFANGGAIWINNVKIHGVKPVPRCVVPKRDPATGEETPGFQERFVDQREATFPSWAPDGAFDHFFKVMLLTRIPEAFWGEQLRVGDRVEPVADTAISP